MKRPKFSFVASVVIFYFAISALSVFKYDSRKVDEGNLPKFGRPLSSGINVTYSYSKGHDTCANPRSTRLPGRKQISILHNNVQDERIKNNERFSATNRFLLALCMTLFVYGVIWYGRYLVKIYLPKFRRLIYKCMTRSAELLCLAAYPLYWIPSLEAADKLPLNVAEASTTMAKGRHNPNKNKETQTAGAYSKRLKKQLKTIQDLRIQNRWKCQKFISRWRKALKKHDIKEKNLKNDNGAKLKLIGQAHIRIKSLEKELWFMDSNIRELRIKLDSQRLENKRVIERYERAYRQMQTFEGQDSLQIEVAISSTGMEYS